MPSSVPLPRRRLLAAVALGGTVAASGCSRLTPASGSDGSSDTAPAPTLALRLFDETASLADRYVYDPTETRYEWDEAAFDAAVNGSAYTTQYRRPFPRAVTDPAYAERDGTYYRLGSVVVGEERVERPVLRLFRVGRVSDLDPVPEHRSAAALPPGDERAVEIAHFAARARGNGGGVPWGLVERGGYAYRDPDAVAASALLGDDPPERVAYRDVVYRVEVTRETFHEPVYRADVDPVADSEAGIEAVLRARVVDARLDPDALSAAERDLVRTARTGRVTASPPFSDALRSLLTAMGHRAYLDGDVSNDGPVENPTVSVLAYGDRYYGYRLSLDPPGGE